MVTLTMRALQLQVLVNSLVTENMDLKRRIGQTEEKLSNIEKLIQDLKKETSLT